MNDRSELVEPDHQQTAVISIDKKIYSKGALLRAFYWLGRDLYFQIDEENDLFRVTVGLKSSVPTLQKPKVKSIEDWLPEVFDALLDAQLRIEIQAETAAVRELIIAKAFAESGVLEDPPPGTFEDPLGPSNRESRHLVTIKNMPD